MENKPLDQEDILNLQYVKNRQRMIQTEIEKIAVERFNLDLRYENAKAAFKDINSTQQNLAKYLQEKYGEGVVDIENKVFIPNNVSK
jgi:hypothetical protein